MLMHAISGGAKLVNHLPILRSDQTSVRLPFRLNQPITIRSRFVRLPVSFKKNGARAFRVLAPTLVALSFAGVAHAQGTMDFSGAQTLMGTFNGRFAYVSVSRASQDAQIFTNDATTLAENLSRDVSKTSALDFGKQQAPVPKLAPEQSQLVKRSPGPGFGLAL
jgi:hypothetical protein